MSLDDYGEMYAPKGAMERVNLRARTGLGTSSERTLGASLGPTASRRSILRWGGGDTVRQLVTALGPRYGY